MSITRILSPKNKRPSQRYVAIQYRYTLAPLTCFQALSYIMRDMRANFARVTRKQRRTEYMKKQEQKEWQGKAL